MTISNPLTAKDFYKADHAAQYPDNTEKVYNNWTARSSRLAPVLRDLYDEKVVVAGIRHYVQDFLINEFNRDFFSKPKAVAVARYKRRLDNALGPGAVDVSNIEALHDLQYLPLFIKALPEGTRCNIKVPMMTVVNTDPAFGWLPNALETVQSCEIWQPMTTATIAYEYRRLLTMYAEKTGAPLEFVPIQGHDFSFRGMPGRAAAATAGFGHLLSFVGTDTIPAIDLCEDYYDADSDEEMVGISVPATEHSVMCMGSKDGEIGTFKRLINELYPTGIVSIVSDTWDYWKVITEYLPELKEDIMARQPNAIGLNKVVIRPDSGDPVRIVAGYQGVYEADDLTAGMTKQSICDWICKKADVEVLKMNGKYWSVQDPSLELSEAEVKGSVQCLWDTFGGTETEKGYKMLDEHIGLIYGDSITLQRARDILERLEQKGFASSNVVFGIGSYTYQYITRDSFGFAVKATYGEIDGEGVEIFKDPATDRGTKKSARGLLRVAQESGGFKLYDQQDEAAEKTGELLPLFLDGKLIRKDTLAEIRERLWPTK